MKMKNFIFDQKIFESELFHSVSILFKLNGLMQSSEQKFKKLHFVRGLILSIIYLIQTFTLVRTIFYSFFFSHLILHNNLIA